MSKHGKPTAAASDDLEGDAIDPKRQPPEDPTTGIDPTAATVTPPPAPSAPEPPAHDVGKKNINVVQTARIDELEAHVARLERAFVEMLARPDLCSMDPDHARHCLRRMLPD